MGKVETSNSKIIEILRPHTCEPLSYTFKNCNSASHRMEGQGPSVQGSVYLDDWGKNHQVDLLRTFEINPN